MSEASEAGTPQGGAAAGERRVIHVLHPRDNVGTALRDLTPAEVVTVERETGPLRVEVLGAVPFGHKLALEAIAGGTEVRKYGEAIGLALQDIAPGEHVHTHNVESQRGRGDLAPHPNQPGQPGRPG